MFETIGYESATLDLKSIFVAKIVGTTDGQCLRDPVSRPPKRKKCRGDRRSVSAVSVYATYQVARK